jgi:hypothetical protein
MRDDPPFTAKIPANVDQPDKLLCQLNARQLAILAATGAVSATVYLGCVSWLPIPAIVAAVFPIVSGGVVLAVARRDGMTLDAYAIAAFLHLRTVKERVTTSEGISPPPAWCRVRGRLPAPLKAPVRAVREDGVLELADGGTAVIVQTGTLSFALRSNTEQASLVAGFGRWLNSLDAPTQILVQTHPVDLSEMADGLTTSAPHLPDPALEAAALDHAAFLGGLANSYDLLKRRVLIVLRDIATDRPTSLPWRRQAVSRQASAQVVARRAEEAVRALTALGLTATILSAEAARSVLIASMSPSQAPLAELSNPADAITLEEPQP